MLDWWGSLRSNPFVVFSTVWVEPVIQRAVDVTHRLEPDLLCTIAYACSIGVAYLFHSPFRAHSTAATDTYGRVTKVFQTWSTIVFFCFHLGPQFFQLKNAQTAAADGSEETGQILFFPLFMVLNVWFALLHKVKRRWQLGVTYGGRLSVIGLNSIILAAVGTVHYAYSSTLYDNASNSVLKLLLYSLTPTQVSVHPFRCLAKLLFLSCCFTVVDYLYKRWHGFDPSRGILWSELYELRKAPALEQLGGEKLAHSAGLEQQQEEEEEDWRLCVAPPRVYTPEALAAAAAPFMPASPHQRWNGVLPPGSLPLGRAGTPVVRVPLASAAETASPQVRSPMLYHECPPDVNMALVESWYDVDDDALKRLCGGGSAVSTPAHSPRDLAHGHADGRKDLLRRSLHQVERADTTLTRLVSFRVPRFFVREAQGAKHPLNRPGMVPWWSTFVLFTAWQTVAGATLRFLAFDVRTIQGFTTPKIFHLHFSPSLRTSMAAAAEMEVGTETTAPEDPVLHCAHTGTSPVTSTASVMLESEDVVKGVSPPSPPVSSTPGPRAEEEPDVWFDWIADVGDGFNPTYAMARLLAQPELQLPFASASKSEWSRKDSPSHSPKHGTSATGITPAATNGASPKARRTSAVAPGTVESPRPLKETAIMGAVRPCAASAPTSPRRSFSPANSTDAPPSQALPPASPSLSASFSGKSTLPRVAAAHRAASRDAVSASCKLKAARRYLTDATAPAGAPFKTAAGRALIGVERDGMATLPRGSFVVIGGDLAYPSPDDDTYTTRLFEPYGDAMGGNVRLQNLFHAEQQRLVVPDRHDRDVAHVHLLDAETVSGVATGRGGLSAGRGTAEEALRSMPLLFAIPGNHDWFDGLTTYRQYILERTWIGGWLMPQKSSFFVLRLPYNWFMLCGDTGNTQDIDAAQRNYFLDVIEKYMDAESCVILAAHEPGWLFDAMERDEKPRQPELNRVVEVLGTRLRLRMAGDIHNYSRHVPVNPTSEAATLVVSGGGGAFLHGARNDRIISQGTRYVRACAFPSRSIFSNMAARLWGFRVVNWKFDVVVGFLCFVILLSALPLPMETDVAGTSSKALTTGPVSLAQVFSLWVAYATSIMSHVLTKGVISAFPLLFFWMCFSSAGADRHASLRWRLSYGAFWTFAVALCCSGAMAFVHVLILYLMDNGLLHSTQGQWASVMETQSMLILTTFADHARQMIGGEGGPVGAGLRLLQRAVEDSALTRCCLVLLRCFDPFETLGYLSMKLSSGELAVFAPDVSRVQLVVYYVYVLFFYWIVITPIVSMLIGTFLLISVTWFDYMYDGTYSAFQIEAFKHFIRFRIESKTRQLHAYVVAEQKPARVYELDRRYMWSLTGQGLEEHRPPHLKRYPSRWEPMQHQRRGSGKGAVVQEHFTVHPHRVPHSPKTPSNGK